MVEWRADPNASADDRNGFGRSSTYWYLYFRPQRRKRLIWLLER
jgi:hypothetical protein